MARVPEGAELIPNAHSGAPGVKIGNIYIMAGVPHIAARMFEALDGKLEGGRPLVTVTLGAYAPESEVADLLREIEADHAGVQIGSYPFYGGGRLGANFVLRGEDIAAVEMCARQLVERLKIMGLEAIEGGITP
jgi:molybdopterin-biosynthesis enzyme MoeA-like protein